MITVADLTKYLENFNGNTPVYFVYEPHAKQKVVIEKQPLQAQVYKIEKKTEECVCIVIPPDYE